MLEKCDDDIRRITENISAVRDYEATIKRRKNELKEGMDLIDGVLVYNTISNVSLRLLIEGILISDKNGKLNVSITLKGDFRHHIDIYEDGEVTDRFFEPDGRPSDEGNCEDWIPCDIDDYNS